MSEKEKELANKISDFLQELHESVIYISNQDEGDMIENAIFDILKERLL